MSVLEEICARKREHVAQKKSETPLESLKQQVEGTPAPLGFIQSLKTSPPPAIIAEVKKASPSKGVIREDFDPVEIAQAYERAGAACLSVLTDEPYFQGQDVYLKQIKDISALPVLRKDFMLEPYQIYESRAMGADCILLIMAALTDTEAQELHDLATELGMDALVEIHDEEELERALALNPPMIGVNNRNLKTLEVDIQTSHSLSAKIPENVLKVTESGIDSPETILNLQNDGFEGFLIGESLMRQENIEAALAHFLQKS